MNNQNSELLTIKEAREYLRCSQGFLWLRRLDGSIKAVKAGKKKVLLVRESLNQFIKL